MAEIDPSARVAPTAKLGRDVRIGPFCVVGEDVALDDEVVLDSHVVLSGRTEIGPRTRVHPFVSIGAAPQDTSYRGEPTRTVIGSDAVIREHVTVHRGTARGRGITRVGDHCYLMAGSHVAHDCLVGDQVILSNNVLLAGHITIGSYVVIGGGAALAQRVRIGDYAFIAGISGVAKDVIPFGYVIDHRGRLDGINVVGMRRRGFSRENIQMMVRLHRILFAREDTFQERLARAQAEFVDDPVAGTVFAFIRDGGGRPLLTAHEGKGD